MRIAGVVFLGTYYKKIAMRNKYINWVTGLYTILISFLCSCASGPERSNTDQTPILSQDQNQSVKSYGKRRVSEIDSPDYEEEIDEILSLARRNRWREAEEEASKLLSAAPYDPFVLRVYTWVKQENNTRRETELENKIREISNHDTRTNPDVVGLLTNEKTDGLQSSADLRETIENIKNAPLIPKSFGKVIESEARLYDLNSLTNEVNLILEKDITLQVSDVSLHDIIFDIGRTENINFISDQSLEAMNQKITMNVQNWKLGQLLRYVGQNLNINFQIGSDIIWISDGSKTNITNLEEIRCFKLRHGFILPAQFGASQVYTETTTANGVTTVKQTETRDEFVQDGAPILPSIEAVISQFFEGSKFYIDRERNLIIARGTYQQLNQLKDIIEAFDKPIQQVYIEARFITVTEAAFLQLGMDWSTITQSAAQGAVDYTGLGASYGVGAGLTKTWTKVFGTDNLNATLYAIEQSGESQTLSSPRITVLNNLPAKIEDGQVQYYYKQYTISQQILDNYSTSNLVPTGEPTDITSGIKLNVMASIGGDGQTILLALSPEVNSEVVMNEFSSIVDYDSSGNPVQSFAIKLPQYTTQKFSTRVAVKSGQTVALGGVMERKQESFSESVPVLSNIPLIGNLFRKRSELDKPRYLLVFVTATIISDTGEFIIAPDSQNTFFSNESSY